MMQELGSVSFLCKQSQGISFVPFHTDEVKYDYLNLQADKTLVRH
jgi:hypothetical protein